MISQAQAMPVAAGASLKKVAAPSPELLKELDQLIELAQRQGFRIDSIHVAQAMLNQKMLKTLEQAIFNPDRLAEIKGKSSRIEFIVEGSIPSYLLTEPALKSEPIYKQVIGYNLCKSCGLCIDVCPKKVYKDDGYGKPDVALRHTEECTGNFQCRQCVDICPENTIHLTLADPIFKSVLYVLLPNPYQEAMRQTVARPDFFVLNPLVQGLLLRIPEKMPAKDLRVSHKILDQCNFFPILKINGYSRHLVDSKTPEADLKTWAKENFRNPELVLDAVYFIYSKLPSIPSLKQGKYSFDHLINRVIDEIILPEIAIQQEGGLDFLRQIIESGFVAEVFSGAKKRPIGGLLPPGTSVAWKTPYGNDVPKYTHLEKCLGPECGLCVTHCPEGAGGENAAIRMVPLVPLGAIPSLVRGLSTYLLNLEEPSNSPKIEDISKKQPFEFEVNLDYCKACGICISCCPHDVIESDVRIFDIGEST
ncbi:4Fe-4S dicluster domain-containing protein [Deltaproteobacteria bacterium TL4]